MLLLQSRRRNMWLLQSRSLPRTRRGCDAARTAVVTHLIDGDVVDDGFIVGVVNIGDIHIGHGMIVGKRIAGPAAALVAGTAVAMSIVHAAVEPDMRTPIADME